MPKRSRTARPHPATRRPQPRLVTKAHREEQDAKQTDFDTVERRLKRIEGPEPKNPAAVALGRLGGLKGGRARAEKLTPAQRHKSAVRAAQARWKKVPKP
jgi:hypothetical protein